MGARRKIAIQDEQDEHRQNGSVIGLRNYVPQRQPHRIRNQNLAGLYQRHVRENIQNTNI